MRRRFAVPLVAVLALVPSAVFFFQSNDFVNEAERSKHPVAASTSAKPPVNQDAIHPLERDTEHPLTSRKSPGELLEQAFAALSTMEDAARDAAVMQLIARLRAAGPQGLEATRKFLASARDVRFRNGFSFSGSQLSTAPTLRMALIEALREWPGSAGALLEVLNSKATVWETTLAIRGLENQFPGTYRNDAIESLKRRIDDPDAWDSTPAAEVYLFDVGRHYQAEELLPQMHAMVMKEPLFRAPGYVRMLDGFSSEARSAALERLHSEPKFSEAFLSFPHTVNFYSFVDERMRTLAVHAFTQIWQPSQKLSALKDISGVPPGNLSTFFVSPREAVWTRAQAENDLNQARARMVLLAELEPAADTPDLQQALKRARERVTREIARQADDRRHENDAPAEIEFASGDGKAVIKGRRIEDLQLRAEPLPLVPADDGSTSEELR